jgi:mono/diheme cytochrome c family protein
MTRKAGFAALTVLCLAGTTALAQDAQRGKLLYETHCLTCHYESIHKRDPSKSLIRTQAQLRVEVANRAALTKQRFTIEDLDDIAGYLNRTHYRLAK